jgi:hypothetical protein
VLAKREAVPALKDGRQWMEMRMKIILQSVLGALLVISPVQSEAKKKCQRTKLCGFCQVAHWRVDNRRIRLF